MSLLPAVAFVENKWVCYESNMMRCDLSYALPNYVYIQNTRPTSVIKHIRKLLHYNKMSWVQRKQHITFIKHCQ